VPISKTSRTSSVLFPFLNKAQHAQSEKVLTDLEQQRLFGRSGNRAPQVFYPCGSLLLTTEDCGIVKELPECHGAMGGAQGVNEPVAAKAILLQAGKYLGARQSARPQPGVRMFRRKVLFHWNSWPCHTLKPEPVTAAKRSAEGSQAKE
jgi:hypothetical protein